MGELIFFFSKGYAEMAVARVANSGYETPLTEHAMDFPEFASVEQTLGRRRMSEMNLSGPRLFPSRSAATPTGGPTQGRKWQSEADSVNQYPEVEGSNLDDGMPFLVTKTNITLIFLYKEKVC